VHPEAYPVVERILKDLSKPLGQVMGDAKVLGGIDAARYTDEQFGLPTVKDILHELEKPGRDPRPEFKTAAFQEGIEDLKDLTAGMVLEGVVTNVTNFGAFVDIGVHQDGLVHISMMSHRFVKDPHEVVKAGDVVKVKVLEVDLTRRRIGLTMKLEDAPRPRSDAARGGAPVREANGGGRRPPPAGGRPQGGGRPGGAPPREQRPREPQGNGVMAEALAKAFKR
jgi:uncharacterized protein